MDRGERKEGAGERRDVEDEAGRETEREKRGGERHAKWGNFLSGGRKPQRHFPLHLYKHNFSRSYFPLPTYTPRTYLLYLFTCICLHVQVLALYKWMVIHIHIGIGVG